MLSAVPSRATAAAELAEEVRGALTVRRTDATGYFDVGRLCRAGGFTVARARLATTGGHHAALLVPDDDGSFRILVDPWRSKKPASLQTQGERYRFLVAHEVGHTFFFDRREPRPRRLIPRSPEEEHFCDEFAASLLFPRSAASAWNTRSGGLMSLRRRFLAPLEVVARSVAALHEGLTVVALARVRQTPKADAGPYAILWSHGRERLPRYAAFETDVTREAARTGAASGVVGVHIGEVVGDRFIEASVVRGGEVMLVTMRPAATMSARAPGQIASLSRSGRHHQVVRTAGRRT